MYVAPRRKKETISYNYIQCPRELLHTPCLNLLLREGKKPQNKESLILLLMSKIS